MKIVISRCCPHPRRRGFGLMDKALIYRILYIYIFLLSNYVASGFVTVNNISSTEISQCIHSGDALLCDFIELEEDIYLESLGMSPMKRVTISNAKHLYFDDVWCSDLELIEVTAYFRNTRILNEIELKLINSNIDNVPNGVSVINIQGSEIGQINNINSLKVVISQVNDLILNNVDISYLKIQSSNIHSLNIQNVTVPANAELSVIGSTITCIQGNMFTAFGKQLKWENNVITSIDNCSKNEMIVTTPSTTTSAEIGKFEKHKACPENVINIPGWIYGIIGILGGYSAIATVFVVYLCLKGRSNNTSKENVKANSLQHMQETLLAT